MLDRRDLIKLSLGAALAKGADGHKFFTSEEYAMVDELTDIIIPTDEKSGGAKAAKVAEYIDQRLAEAFGPEERDDWRKQLALIDHKASKMYQQAFLKCHNSQRIAVVESIQKEPFFETLKSATIRAYYTSKIGIHDEMDYKGNTYQQGEYSGDLPPHVAFPANPRDRLAVASYPFRKLVDPKNGTLALVDFPQMVADRFGVHGVELLGEHFPSTDAAYLEKLRAAVEKSGSRVVNIPVDRLGASFYDADEERRKVAISTAKHWIDVANAVGSPSVRVHMMTAKNPPDVALAAESLRQVASYGEAKNVVVHLENDDAHSEEAFFLVDVIKAVNTMWLRALPDFCNSMLLERGDDYNYKAMAALFDHAYGICHVKDSEQDGKKMFRVDLGRTFEIARAARYRGYFSMEYDAEGDPSEPTSGLIAGSSRALIEERL
ncbi:MAG: gluconate 2-dehydrogenase subunit 3 family protein [Bryobacteraceae bacterium]